MGAQVRSSSDEVTALARIWTELSPEMTDRIMMLTEERQKHDIEMDRRDMKLHEETTAHRIELNQQFARESAASRRWSAFILVGVLVLMAFAVQRGESILAAVVAVLVAGVIATSIGSARPRLMTRVLNELEQFRKELQAGDNNPEEPEATSTAS